MRLANRTSLLASLDKMADTSRESCTRLVIEHHAMFNTDGKREKHLIDYDNASDSGRKEIDKIISTSSTIEIDKVCDIVPFAKEIIKTLYDHKGLTMQQFFKLKTLIEECPQDQRLFLKSPYFDYNPYAFDCNAYISFREFAVGDDERLIFMPVLIVRELVQALLHADRLTRCQECEAILLREERSPLTAYCSVQCAGKVRQRRYVKRKKDQNKSESL